MSALRLNAARFIIALAVGLGIIFASRLLSEDARMLGAYFCFGWSASAFGGWIARLVLPTADA